MIKLKKLINESVWDRKFGEPLPTLSSVLEKHSGCECEGHGDCGCAVTEDVKDIPKAKKKLQRLMKDESTLRLHMWELVSIMSKDEVNKKLANQLKDSYKKNVTNFMRDTVRLVKGVK